MRCCALALAVTAGDQLAKILILDRLSAGDSVPLIPGVFHLSLVLNTGISFGLFRGHEGLLFGLITASLGILIVLTFRMRSSPALVRTAMGLILGGAVGNWIDRLRFGAVVDFLDFRVWPVFNLADTAICTGVALYACFFFFSKKSRSDLPDRGHP